MKTENMQQLSVPELKQLVENVRSCGGGTKRQRQLARRELLRRGFAWFIVMTDNSFEVKMLPKDTTNEDVWSRACVSPGAAFDRLERKKP